MKQYSVSLPNAASDVQVMGRVTRDVEMHYLEDGTAVSNVSVALSRRWLPKDSEEWKEKTQFISFGVWGEEPAKRAAKLVKGDIVLVGFSLSDLKPESYKSGEETRLSIKCDRAQVSRVAWANGEGGEAPAQQPAEEGVVSFS